MSPADDEADLRLHCVVVNTEEQWSIWPAEKPIPAGWSEVGVSGSKAECLSHIETHWTDIRPLSARRPD